MKSHLVSRQRRGPRSWRWRFSCEELEPRCLLAIDIFAAGATGSESLSLQVEGESVQTWTNVAGNYDDGVFQQFTYDAEGISVDSIRVAFVNDGNTPGGLDKNLRVDRIVVDGVTYQAEAPNVLSTGTWTSPDGCAPGYKQSEYLHCNGYLAFAGSAGGSVVRVLAAGATGQEVIELRIDGTTVSTFSNIGGNYSSGQFVTYTHVADSLVTADQVEVAFVNDGNTPGGLDKNVRVDGIEIDGQFFESEAATVWTTGTWTDPDGCTPGYKQSEYLHCEGSLFYATTASNPGVIGLATNAYSIDEDAGSVDVVIERGQGSDGNVTVDYRTYAGSASEGEDFQGVSGTAEFLAGETFKVISVPILDDVLEEETELFSFTIDNVQGGATLLVPRTALISILDDENPVGGGDGLSFDYRDFSNPVDLQFNGDADTVAGRLQLTDDGQGQVGSAFHTAALALDTETSFASLLEVQLSGGQGTGGADGLAFVLANTPDGPQALGAPGDGLGYYAIGTASMAIELDTYQNEFDPSDNHVSLLTGGDVVAPLATSPSPVDLNGGGIVYVWIEYDGAGDLLEVFVSSAPTQPDQPLLSHEIDLSALLGSQAFLGVSASTGGLGNEHNVLAWKFGTSGSPNSPTSFDEEIVIDGLTWPSAIEWSGDGENMYISELPGIVRVFRDGQLLPAPVVDISPRVNFTDDRGLLDIAVHPDLANHPYLYLIYAYDPPEVMNYAGLAGPDGAGNRAGRMERFTLDATTDYTTIVPGSEVVLLGSNSTWENFNAFVDSTNDFDEPPAGVLPGGENLRDFLAADSRSHTVGQVEFGLDGALYVTNGDGVSFNQVDPRAVRVQDVDNLSVKVLRLDPLTGAGLADNPFYDGDPQSNRSKVFQLGFRNPFRFTIHPSTGQIFVGDVGWTMWEEVNTGDAGDNFGWPYYEGASGASARTSEYQNLPEAQAFYASGEPVTPAILALNHGIDGINAIVMGDVYDGDVYSEDYRGDLLFNDLGQGIVRNVSFNADGSIASVETFTTGAEVVVHIRTGPDGYLYYVDLDDGVVGRWIESANQAVASGSSSTFASDDATIALALSMPSPASDTGANATEARDAQAIEVRPADGHQPRPSRRTVSSCLVTSSVLPALNRDGAVLEHVYAALGGDDSSSDDGLRLPLR